MLSALGAQRIGLQTTVAQAVPTPPPIVTTTIVHGVKTTTSTPAPKPAAAVIIPYSAVIYDPSGKTYAFTNTAPLTFIEVPITVDHISGNSVYLATRPEGRGEGRLGRGGGALRRADRGAGADVIERGDRSQRRGR